MKKHLAWVLPTLAAISISVSFKYFSAGTSNGKKPAAPVQSEETSYWTCPMHPQIHSEKPGECPICHMKLVSVRAQETPEESEDDAGSRSEVVIPPERFQLLGAQKIAVQKMDLIAEVPISGHLISPTSVAFQVYESDARSIRPGQTFRGQSTMDSKTEIQGQIHSVDSIVDPTSRTVRVVGQIKNGPRGLISETTFSGRIEILLKGVTAIPESSVLHTGRGDLVYMIHDHNTLMAQNVKLGQKAESYYEVVDGLEPGQFISSGPNFLIDSEAKIRGTSGGHRGHSHH